MVLLDTVSPLINVPVNLEGYHCDIVGNVATFRPKTQLFRE